MGSLARRLWVLERDQYRRMASYILADAPTSYFKASAKAYQERVRSVCADFGLAPEDAFDLLLDRASQKVEEEVEESASFWYPEEEKPDPVKGLEYDIKRLESNISIVDEKLTQSNKEAYKDTFALREAVRQIRRMLVRGGLAEKSDFEEL